MIPHITGSAHPIFVGGTGRCGTHALADLIAAGGAHARVPEEIRVHVTSTGMPGFISGRFSRIQTLRALRRVWWKHGVDWNPGAVVGLYEVADRKDFARALLRMATAPPRRDRARIAGRFMEDLLDPLARREGAPSWVEKSPDNCLGAGYLWRMIPGARFIEIHRDGRDVASSLIGFPWAPNTFGECLDWWEARRTASIRGMRAVPSEQRLTIALEDLVRDSRESTLDRIARFTEPRDPAAQRRWFDRELTPERARIGRWRDGLSPAEAERVEERYRRAAARVAAVEHLVGEAPGSGDPLVHSPR